MTRVNIRHILFVAISGLFLFSTAIAQAQFDNRPYKNRAQAQKYYNDFKSLVAGKDKINQPIRKLQDALNVHFDKMRKAVNSSESDTEIRSKFRIDKRMFDSLKTDFDLAIKFTRSNVANTRFKDIKGFGSMLQEALAKQRRIIDQLERAFENNDIHRIDQALEDIRESVNDVNAYGQTHLKAVKENIAFAGGQLGVKQTKQVGCPHPFGSMRYFLECIDLGQLATSNSE